jgi:hypothetical protein
VHWAIWAGMDSLVRKSVYSVICGCVWMYILLYKVRGGVRKYTYGDALSKLDAFSGSVSFGQYLLFYIIASLA